MAKVGGQEQKPTRQATPAPSLLSPEKRNYRELITQFSQQVNQLSLSITQLQSFVLQMKQSAPVPDLIDSALEALLGANRQLTASIQNVTASTGQQQTESLHESAKGRKYFVRQTETRPMEKYEVREAGELSPVHVTRCPRTGDYQCLSDDAVSRGKNNRHVEAVKQWLYLGYPKVVEYSPDPDIDTSNSGTPVDTKLSGGSYERPGFWGTHQPVGYPDRRVAENYIGTDRLGKWNTVLGKHGFKKDGDCLYVCRNSRTYVFVHPDTENWTHRKITPGLSVNGTGLKSLSEHLSNFTRMMRAA